MCKNHVISGTWTPWNTSNKTWTDLTTGKLENKYGVTSHTGTSSGSFGSKKLTCYNVTKDNIGRLVHFCQLTSKHSANHLGQNSKVFINRHRLQLDLLRWTITHFLPGLGGRHITVWVRDLEVQVWWELGMGTTIIYVPSSIKYEVWSEKYLLTRMFGPIPTFLLSLGISYFD